MCRSVKLTAVETLDALAAGRAELARLEALAVLLEAVGALAGAALLDFRRAASAFPGVDLAHKGVRVLVHDVLNGLVSELLVSRH